MRCDETEMMPLVIVIMYRIKKNVIYKIFKLHLLYMYMNSFIKAFPLQNTLFKIIHGTVVAFLNVWSIPRQHTHI